MAKYFWLGISNVLFLILGLWIGGVLCGLQPLKQAEIIYPSPVVYSEGKRSEPGVISLDTLHAIEIQTAREMFGGKMRDPFIAKSKGGRDGCVPLRSMWLVW